jgi:5-(carboxyamino)imidazole ribonucleotide synthase
VIVGVLGGGQLGRMLALAGLPLGLQFRFYDPSPEACAGQVGDLHVGEYDDVAAFDRFADGLDVVTYEFENAPVAVAERLSERVPVFPPPAALDVAQDRLAEKALFQRLGIPTVRFAPVGSADDLARAIDEIGLPAILKTRRLGYDGKGQVVVRTPEDAGMAWSQVNGVPSILEGWAPFSRELSILSARGRAGAVRAYPLVENHHRDGILRLSLAPAADGLDGAIANLQAVAEGFASRVLDALGYVGLLAIELFVVDGRLVANELAPRVHNSGHWTIEGAATSQFEQHLRAVLGLPLGSVETPAWSAMVNLIGTVPALDRLLGLDGAHVHLYGKAPRAGRKLGHVTLVERDRARRDARCAELERLLSEADRGA